MKVFGIVLFLGLLPNEWTKISRAVRAQGQADSQIQEPTTDVIPIPMNSTDDENASETEAPFCSRLSSHTRYFVDVELTNVPEVKSVSNAFGCCELCQDNQACQAWTWNRDTKECTIGYAYEGKVRGDPDEGFDGGYIGSRINGAALGVTREDVLIRPCPVTTGVRYPGGNRVGEGRVRHPRGCCNTCRFSSDCRSWYYSSSTQRCILNGNTPRRMSASGNFAGGAF